MCEQGSEVEGRGVGSGGREAARRRGQEVTKRQGVGKGRAAAGRPDGSVAAWSQVLCWPRAPSLAGAVAAAARLITAAASSPSDSSASAEASAEA
jgi:hypothetical protein